MVRSPLFHVVLLGSSFLTACGSSEEASPAAAAPAHCLDAPADGSQRQKQQVLVTGHSIFDEDAHGRPLPQPARMQIWCKNAEGQWTSKIVDDPDSNVFHKIIPMDDGSLVSIGAMGAFGCILLSNPKENPLQYTSGARDSIRYRLLRNP